MKQISIYFINSMIMLILVIIMKMISVAFLTLFERKIMGLFHYRKGPNKISVSGLLQPFSDAMKLMTKEFFYPMKSNFYLYLLSPMLMFLLIMMLWLLYPFYTNLVNFNLSTLFLLSIMSITVYSIMMSGWSSNSNLTLIGSIRSMAQSISYEVIFSINLLIFLMINNSMNFFSLKLIQYYMWMFMLCIPLSLILFLSLIAEINRTPFDLSEGESELVSGFNTEYSNSPFTLIFLAEYASLLFMMFLFNFLYLYNNLMNILFYLILMLLIFLITWIRMTFPRIRYDKLMYMCWFYFLPSILIFFMFMMLMFKYSTDLIFMLN
uniref:NADH-ubiquinone oxidoreductase chain 1 n=1 Tax=Ichneutes sp. QL-2013 TaxID=1421596 RepID=A0A0A6ZLW7_9HYME|nr:NADH dehydrogenase subunit 1 [Ichneutes sp. QL-2013]